VAPVIETEGLTKHFGDVRAAEDVTFSVPEGEVFGFLGPNGAGKTTVIRLLLGLLAPTRGTARVLGARVDDREAFAAVRGEVGYLPSDAVLYPELTGRQVLDFLGSLSGADRREELLELFPVPLDRHVRTYSRGNKQKLAIVQAFMHSPRLVVMDEPTSGLDPLVQERFAEFLGEERDRGVTAFFSTHVLSEVRAVCDTVAIIRDGRLVAVEGIEELLDRGGTVVEARMRERVDPADFAFDGVVEAAAEGDRLRLVVSGNFDALVDALAPYDVLDLDVRESAVEDVFRAYYEGEAGETGETDATVDGGGGPGGGDGRDEDGDGDGDGFDRRSRGDDEGDSRTLRGGDGDRDGRGEDSRGTGDAGGTPTGGA
jgi:ABC-2 type transport system ATP-binding protein